MEEVVMRDSVVGMALCCIPAGLSAPKSAADDEPELSRDPAADLLFKGVASGPRLSEKLHADSCRLPTPTGDFVQSRCTCKPVR